LAVAHGFKGDFGNLLQTRFRNISNTNCAVNHGMTGQVQNRQASILVCLKNAILANLAVAHGFKGNFRNSLQTHFQNISNTNYAVNHGMTGQVQNR